MPLTGKYLKYSPEITPEIFVLVWDKLKSIFPNKKIFDWTRDWSFESFKKYRYISIWGGDDDYSFGINNNSGIGNRNETTVQEILGYDPFMKENYISGIDLFIEDDFVLPDKWYVRVTKENYAVLNNWRINVIKYSEDNFDIAYQIMLQDGSGGFVRGYENKTEITFDQFKKYVLKETNPEYVECINAVTPNTRVGEIFKCRHSNRYFEFEYNDKSKENFNSWDGWSVSWSDKIPQRYFKPSTKEAFDMQNQPKSVNNGFFVVLQNKLTSHPSAEITIGKIYKADSQNEFNDEKNIKWFATKAEAEEFAKTLVEPVKQSLIKVFPVEGYCEKNSDIIKYLSKSKTIYESSIGKENDNKFKFICWNEAYYWFTCDKSSKQYYSFTVILALIQKEKQLKQAVHCTTQEEWDFVTKKLGYKWSEYSKWSVHENNTCINLKRLGFGTAEVAYKGYQILSFQEWCDLNGYKMEKEFKFEVGKWYKCKNHNYAIKYLREKAYDFVYVIVYSDIIDDNKNYKSYPEGKTGVGYTNGIGWYELKDLSEIQQYLPDDHIDKIKSNQEFKDGDWIVYYIESKNSYITSFKLNDVIQVINGKANNTVPFIGVNDITNCFRHATPEEIYNHSSFIGQIQLEKYPFKKLEEDDLTWEIKTEGIRWTEPVPITKDNWKHEMLLSVDDEEFPMVNIIKTNTIKQLLNND